MEAFGKYALLDRIDVSGSAEIFVARRADGEPGSERLAIKRLSAATAQNQEVVGAFTDEAWAAGHLDHPGVAKLVEVGVVDGQHFMALELVEGESLRQILDRLAEAGARMPVDIACRIVALACAAIDYAHRVVDATGRYLAITQRRCAPRKILVSSAGDVKVIGFGATRPNDISGYSSPEQMRGTAVDWRADVFALGAILYECVTGRPAYPGGAPAGAVELPSAVDPALPSDVERIVLRALAARCDERYQSCAEMATELWQQVPGEAPEAVSGAIAAWLGTGRGGAHARASTDVDEDAPADDAPVHLDENVQFSVYRPKSVTPDEWHQLLAFAHLSELPPDAKAGTPDPIEEVQRQAAQVLGAAAADYRDVVADSEHAVPREGEITFVPSIPGFTFNPPRRTFLWLESVHREEFRFKVGPEHDGTTARGRLTAYLGSIILAEVTLSIRVDSQVVLAPVASSMQTSAARPYRRIFASYSHADVAVVEQFERHAKALGDEYLRDMVHLRSGEVWDARLEQLIEQADVFQLFWSTRSMHSKFVRQEWEHALSLRRERFVRPTYWEDPLPTDPILGLPPEELVRLHFQRLGPAIAGEAELVEAQPAEPAVTERKMLVCDRCGKENQSHYKFCLGCGADLATAAGAGAETSGAAKTMMASVGSTPPPGGGPMGGPPQVGGPVGFPPPPGGHPMGGVAPMQPAGGHVGFPPAADSAPMGSPPPPGGGPGAVMGMPFPAPPTAQSAPVARPRSDTQPVAEPPCRSCGAAIPPGFKFCGRCGTQVADRPGANTGAQAAAPSPVQAVAPRGHLTLIHPDGSRGDSVALTAGVNTIGRDHGALYASDSCLSPTHAELVLNGSSAIVRDLDSANGVYVRMVGEQEIYGGQEFRVGQHILRFDVLEPSVPDIGGVEVLATSNPGYWGRLSVVMCPGGDGAAFALLAEVVCIGRERGDINFPGDGYMSGAHAELSARDGSVFLRDLDSSNGTFVRVQGERTVGTDARIMLGQQMFELSLSA